MFRNLLMLTFSPCSLHQEKVKYYDLATERRAEFEKAMAQYNKKKVILYTHIAHVLSFLSHASGHTLILFLHADKW